MKVLLARVERPGMLENARDEFEKIRKIMFKQSRMRDQALESTLTCPETNKHKRDCRDNREIIQLNRNLLDLSAFKLDNGKDSSSSQDIRNL